MEVRHERQDFIGGLRQRVWVYAADIPWPSTRLRLTQSGMEVGPSNVVFRTVPRWAIPYSRVERAEYAKRFGWPTSGVRFFVVGQGHPFIFLYFHPERVLKTLEEHCVPVDYSPHLVRFFRT
jgi:hypothetical protein